MRRTQVYLEESERRLLHLLSQKEHTSFSELIRRAIKKTYFRADRDRDMEKVVNSIAGIWAKRRDLGSTNSYIRSLRKGKRLGRFYG